MVDRILFSAPTSRDGGARILPCGDAALAIEFGDVIDVNLNDEVLALDVAVTERAHEAITETVPTYRSLMVH